MFVYNNVGSPLNWAGYAGGRHDVGKFYELNSLKSRKGLVKNNQRSNCDLDSTQGIFM